MPSAPSDIRSNENYFGWIMGHKKNRKPFDVKLNGFQRDE